MGAPVLIGAGIGAVGALATRQNPFKGALLGGLSGGAFGGSTGFGSGFTEGGLFNLGSEATKAGIQSGISGLPETVGSQAIDTLPSSIGIQYPTEQFVQEGLTSSAIDSAFPAMTATSAGIQNQSLLNANMLTPADATRMDKLFYQTPDTLWEKTQQLGKEGYDWIKDNPYQALQGTLMAGSLMNPTQPNLPPQASGGSIKQGQLPTIGKPLAVNIPPRKKQIRIG